jgi:hypothetical protein
MKIFTPNGPGARLSDCPRAAPDRACRHVSRVDGYAWTIPSKPRLSTRDPDDDDDHAVQHGFRWPAK